MAALVRTWNLFHGNSQPPSRKSHLEEMVRLVTHDRPDVVLLQEVPAWAVSRLSAWTGMTALGEVASRPSVGPIPATAAIGAAITRLNHGLFRSAFAGQANAVLLGAGCRLLAYGSLVLNARRFRRAQARWLGLPLVARLAWAKERRVCQAIRLILPDGRSALVANMHATAFDADQRLADAEILRAAVFADALAQPGDVTVLGGDLNVSAARSRTLSDLSDPEWGFSRAGEGIDHLLVRGAPATRPARWKPERRRPAGHLLSDHAPVEVVIS